MANLFVVFTPLQVVVAQQIIIQEKLNNNIMLESYVKGNSHFTEIYRLIRDDKLWSKIIFFDNWPFWDFGGTQILKNFFEVRKKSKEIKSILQTNKIDIVYLADYQNQTNRFSCFWLTKIGYKVIFFEEGYSHYIPRVSNPPSNGFGHSAYERILDWCYYKPFFNIMFAKWRCYPNRDYHGLPMYLRYSVIPDVHKEAYDKVLEYEPMVSPKLQEYINGELDDLTDGKKVLLLTDPMSEVLPSQYRYLYFETISDALDKYKDECVVVKFHPRDCEKDKTATINLIKDKGLTYSILGQRINIPVELYLQNSQFGEILFFNTSTYFYNGYLYPQTKFVKLLPLLHQKCLDGRVPCLQQMEALIKVIDN